MDYTTIIDTTTSSQSSAVFYGLMGAASGLILSSIGAAYGSSKPNIFHSQSSSLKNFFGVKKFLKQSTHNEITMI